MKKITLLFLFSIFCFMSNAQILTEGFEAGIPAGWTQTQMTGTTNWITSATNGNNTVSPRTGSLMARFSVGNYSSRTRLETPALDLTTVTTPVLTFYYTNADWGGDTEELRVFYKTSAAGVWTLLTTYTASQDAWTEVNIVLPDPSNDYYIGFEGKSNWGYALTLDDVLVDELSGCLPPGSLGVLPTSTTDTDLSWVSAGSEGDWTYEYGATGYTQGTGALGGGSVTAETASISGLTAGIAYDFYVQANCGGTDGDSGFTGPFTWTQPDTGEACGTAIVATLEADCGTATPLTLDFSATTTSGGGSCDTFNNIGYWVTTTTDALGGLTINASAAVDVAIFSDCSGSEEACYGGGVAPSTDIVLSPNTQYYMYFWVEVGNTSSVDVCISSYTPAPAPDCAEAPISPVDSATGVLIPDGELNLTWTAPSAGPAPTDYEFFFGTTSGSLVSVGTVGSTDTFIDLINLQYSTTYYWRVVPINGSTPGTGCAEWTFTTESAPPPPANDACSGANFISGLPYAFSQVDGANATNNAGFITSCSATSNGSMNDGLWFTFTPATSGTVDIVLSNVAGTFDPQMDIYSGSCGTLSCVASADTGGAGGGESIIAQAVTAGTQYFINVGNYSGFTDFPEGSFDISVTGTFTLGIDIMDTNAFTYFPNPVKNTLQLNAQSNIQNVSIFNMLGQEVLRTAPNNVNSTVDMSAMQTGAYFVKVTINDRIETVRVIKQ